MATFCAKCGAGVSPDKRFCSACGAPVETSAIPVSPASAPMYGQPAPVYSQPAASGNSAVKVILIVVGALLGLGLLAVALFTFVLWRVSKSAHHTRDGMTISTPGGTITMGRNPSVTAAQLGVPIYPGAVREEGGMQIRSAKSEVVSALYSTPDPPEKVLDFYKNNLPANASVSLSGSQAHITAGDHETWMISVDTDPFDSSKTKITIMHIKKS